ncbi:peptide ABC transporter substrate-binding protein [Aerophototrophica crusticola]|uniref:Peptide ABC transporter substrate-binding protein n=1 Tax=Aerophototrophica crusticola TaxID=1709002 RepID=A0A858R3T7_9PROT|nr:peptide ABC transporter substrate-binding protein [Rhodospirillaceae bacterium B3]
MRFVRRLAPAIAAAALAATLTAAPAFAEMVLNRGNQAEPSSLDPHKGTDMQSARIGYDLFEGLLTFAPDGKAIPGVAERWEISADGLTYTFFLRKDAKWSDGTPVTAEDFVFSWRRLVDPKTASDYAYFLWPVKNGEAISNGKAPLDSMGVVAKDPHTLVVTLERPTGYFLSSLIHRMTYPVSKANVEKFGPDFVKPGNMVSNGAYRMVEAVPQAYVKAVKNPHFREASTVKIDTVLYHHTDSQETELRRFRAGELDTLQMAPVTQIDWLKQNMPDVMEFYPVLGIRYLGVNMVKGPLANEPKVRLALALAVDRETLTEKVTKAGEPPKMTFIPDGIPGYQSPDLPFLKMTQAERDAMAKKLVAEAGYGPGGKPLAFEIMHATNESTRKTMVAIASMWQQKLGAKVSLNNQEWKVVLQKAGEKDYNGLVELGWIGDFPDPYTFMKLFLGSVGKMNRSGYKNADYDALLDKANATVDPAERLKLMAQAEAMLLQDAPLVVQFHATYRNLVHKHVKGWFESPMGVQPTRYLSIQK